MHSIDPKRPVVYGILMPGEHVIGGIPVIKVKDVKDDCFSSKQTLLHTSQLIDRQYARIAGSEGRHSLHHPRNCLPNGDRAWIP